MVMKSRVALLLAVLGVMVLTSCSSTTGPVENTDESSEAVTYCQTTSMTVGNGGSQTTAGPISFIYPSSLPTSGIPWGHTVTTSHNNGTHPCTYSWTLSGSNWINPTNTCVSNPPHSVCVYAFCPQFPAGAQMTNVTSVNVTQSSGTFVANVTFPMNNAPQDDGNPCTDDSCSGTTAVHTPAPGRSCSDGNVCNGMEACNAAGSCVSSGNAPTGTACTDPLNACHNGTCSGGTCGTFTNKPDGTLCAGDQCTNRHVCTSGTCGGSALPAPTSSDPCTVSTCDPTLGYVSKNNCATDPSFTPSALGAGGSITDFASSIAFLYTGAGAPQQGVTAIIDPTEASVVRGRVLNRSGVGVSGATVSILNHPEFGHTTARTDGWYDLAINGGGDVVVKIDAGSSYIPLQRHVHTVWKRYAIVGDAMLTSKNATAPVALLSTGSGSGGGTTWTTVRGNTETDVNGTRKATILFPPGTKAMNLTAASYSVSASEVTSVCTSGTMCPNGPKAMPAELPSNSGYTYAVDLHIDEADTAGVPVVTFNQDVPFYVEQMNFPANPPTSTVAYTPAPGTSVPTGYYDTTTGNWVKANSGVVVKITGVSGGVATVDSGGMLSLSTGELTQLGGLYTTGTTLWRVPVSHFTLYDSNWGFGTPPGAQPPPAGAAPTTGDPVTDGCESGSNQSSNTPGLSMSGSFIECHNQALRESIPVTDTPYSLNYSSRRAAAGANKEVTIPLVGTAAPSPTPSRIDVTVNVAGEVNTYSTTSVSANEKLTWTWDGKDGYGRTLQGAQQADITVAYVYAGVIGTTANFGDYPGVSVGGSRAGREIALSRTYEVTVGGIVADPLGFGGWTISGAHYFDPVSGRLELGTGDVQKTTAASVHRIAGALVSPGAPPVTNGSSALTQDFYVFGVKAGPDGSIFVAANGYGNSGMLFQILPNDNIYLVAGNGSTTGPTLSASNPSMTAVGANVNFNSIAVDRDGSVLVHDTAHAQVYRVGPPSSPGNPASRTIYWVAGTGVSGHTDGAVNVAQFSSAAGGAIAVARDGTIYMGDAPSGGAQGYVRRITTAGIVDTIAGSASGTLPTQTPSVAKTTDVYTPSAIAISAQGDVYLGNSAGRLYKISGDGNIVLVSGSGVSATPDGVAVSSYYFLNGISDLAFDSTGRLYVSNIGGDHIIRYVGNDGIVHRYAGTGIQAANWNAPDSDGKPPLATNLYDPEYMTVGADDAVTFAGFGYSGVYKAAGLGTQINIPSADRSEVYTVVNGVHMETKSALTGQGTLALCYDGYGLLTKLIDETCSGAAPACGTTHTGCETVITRTGQSVGNPTGTSLTIAAPFGRTTTLTMTGGFATTVADPIGNTYYLTYVNNGLVGSAADLLSSYADPLNHSLGQTHGFTYTADSLLLTDVDPKSATSHLARTLLQSGWQVDVTTPQGRARRLTVDRTAKSAASGVAEPVETLTSRLASGAVYTSVRNSDDSFTTTNTLIGATKTSSFAADPRLGWDGRYAVTSVKTMGDSGGHYRRTQEWRTATITDPNNPLTTATSETDQIEINPNTPNTNPPTFDSGRIFTRSTTFGSTPSVTLTTPQGRNVTKSYDSFGRVTGVTVPSISSIAIGYDSYGRVGSVTQGSRTRTLTYNTTGTIGALASVTDNINGTTTYNAYDGDNRPTQLTLPGSRTLTYSYDVTGNLSTVLTPNQVGNASNAHTFGYDGNNLLASYKTPTTTTGVTTTYGYDADRLLTSVLTPQPDTVSYSYDSGARITTRDGAAPATWTYDSLGRLSTETANGLTYTYNYDGALLTSVVTSGLFARTTSFAYDAFARIGTRTVDGVAASISYDNDEVLASSGPVSNVTWSTNGLLSSTTVGSITDSYATYNTYGELTDYKVPTSGALYEEAITRNATLGGRVTTKSETISGGTAVAHSYTYDSSNRLWTDGAATYTYDADGNRTDICTTPGNAGNYDIQDRMTTTCKAGVSYTNDGRMTNDGTNSYTYDALGNLTTATVSGTTLTYTVDAENRIVRKTGGSYPYQMLYAQGPYPVAQLNASGAVVATFHYATGRNVPDAVVSGGVTYKIITDHLGSVRLVVNATTSTIVQRIDYDAWGQATVTGSMPNIQPFGFAGGLFDQETKLVRFGARDYNARIARWMTKDPIRFGGGMNLYAYTDNDPVNRIDVNGKVSLRCAEGLARTCSSECSRGWNPACSSVCLATELVVATIDPSYCENIDQPPQQAPGGEGGKGGDASGGRGGGGSCPEEEPGPESSEVDCKEISAMCISDCTWAELPTRNYPGHYDHQSASFQRCVSECMSTNGC